MAYFRWGPLWRRRGQAQDEPEVLFAALTALRNEYVRRRGFFLRVFPILFDGGTVSADLLKKAEFSPTANETPQQTVLADLEPSLEELRKRMLQKWRNCLNHAERNNLSVVEGTGDDLFEKFIPLYKQMVARKKFKEPNDIEEFNAIQRSLPAELKMNIFLCSENGELGAGAICSAVGDTGVYLFGATNELGMANKGAYLLQWRVLQWLKTKGYKQYNLNGVNPVANPGGYHFKAGVAGKAAREPRYLGRFDCDGSVASAAIVRAGLRTLPVFKRALSAVRPINRSLSGLRS
jgi:lipid II:glycine glycyltransferase (peptidoglycan interpeptide bridge formation enzyme)